MWSTNVSMMLLALSPVIVVASYCVVLFKDVTGWLLVPSLLSVYGPLLHVTIVGKFGRRLRKKTRKKIRTLLGLATGTVVVTLLGGAMALSPRYLLNPDPEPPTISLRLSPGRQKAHDVIGLNVRWAPQISRAPADADDFFAFDMSHKGGSTGGRPPRTVEDEYGNHVVFTEVRPGVLRLEDNIGGFAEVDWNGANPVLVDSKALPRTASARGPKPSTWRASMNGQLLLLIGPQAAWLLLTVAVLHLYESSTYLLSLIGQGIGLAVGVLLLMFWISGGTSGPQSGMADAFTTLFALGGICLTSGGGLIVLLLTLLNDA